MLSFLIYTIKSVTLYVSNAFKGTEVLMATIKWSAFSSFSNFSHFLMMAMEYTEGSASKRPCFATCMVHHVHSAFCATLKLKSGALPARPAYDTYWHTQYAAFRMRTTHRNTWEVPEGVSMTMRWREKKDDNDKKQITQDWWCSCVCLVKSSAQIFEHRQFQRTLLSLLVKYFELIEKETLKKVNVSRTSVRFPLVSSADCT